MNINEAINTMSKLLENINDDDIISSSNHQYNDPDCSEEFEFSELELRLADRFIELVGGADRARDLINKCDECHDCLGLVNDDDAIDDIAKSVPSEVDYPTINGTDLSSLYNPNTTSSPFVQ